MTAFLRTAGLCVLACALASPAWADPIRIAYLATDLADTIPGDDRWEYRYFVSGFTFSADQGFSINFDPAHYADLDDPPPAAAPGWDAITLQPDPGLSSAGLYDALALVDAPPIAFPFIVSFAWFGGPGEPGPQAFTVNTFDASGMLTVIAAGTTVPYAAPVPEPATLALVALGAGAMAIRTRRTGRLPRGQR